MSRTSAVVVGDLIVTFSTQERPIAFDQAAGFIKLWNKKKTEELPYLDESSGEDHYVYFYFNTGNKAVSQLLPYLDGEKVSDRIREMFALYLPDGFSVVDVWVKDQIGLAGLVTAISHLHSERVFLY